MLLLCVFETMSAADKSENSKPKVLKTWECEECGSRNPKKAQVCLFCSDDEENEEVSDDDESISTKHFSTKQAILEQLQRERFGIIGEEIFNRVKDRLVSRDAWSISKGPDQFEEKWPKRPSILHASKLLSYHP